jgi:thiol-disulfide isomerase/thioredoxin
MRLICAAAASLVLGLFVAIADDKKPTEPPKGDAGERLAGIRKKYEKELEDLKKRVGTAKDQAERKGIIDEAQELTVLTSRDVLKIAEDNPKDPIAIDAAEFVIEKNVMFGPRKETDAAVNIIATHHINSPKVKDLITRLAATPAGPQFFATEAAEKLLKNLSENSTDKDVKGLAFFFLGKGASQQLDDEEDPKKVDSLINRAIEYFRKADKEAPDAKVGTTTIGKEVVTQLESLEFMRNLSIGRKIPDIEGTDLGGNKVKLSNYKGKVLLLDIWATWCGPCRAMIPHERELVKGMKNKPFVLLSVSADNEQETLMKFFEKEPMPWEHWFDGKTQSVTKALRIRAFPTMYLIDHTGVIRYKWVGSPGNEKIDHAVEELVKEAEKAKG